jgi:eukaryotic-like serine/threonine-protein kinase
MSPSWAGLERPRLNKAQNHVGIHHEARDAPSGRELREEMADLPCANSAKREICHTMSALRDSPMGPAPADWPRVREVFEAALRLPLEERRAFVVASCGLDEALAGQVQELLGAHDRANGFLETPATVTDLLSAPDMEGKRVGPYHLAARIGAGGMGEVYKARDTRLDRTVAVKILPTPVAHDSQARERFEREARSVAALNHPHICTLYDIGTSDDVDFLVMEYVDGDTLHGPLAGDEALRLALQIASALAAAHHQGILHRDIKPGNVMVTASGVKLLDFGLAKSMEIGKDATVTSTGTVLGTVAYMSPEQAQGLHLDARSDIFSFGAVLYEMVSGTRAFNGATTPQVLSAVLRDDPPPLWPSSPLEPVVRKCLAKQPGERFQTMDEVLDALRAVVMAPVKEAPSIAVLPFASMIADADNEFFSDGIAEEIINALAQLEGLRVAAHTSSFSFKGRSIEAGEIARRLNVRHLLEGSVRKAGGRVRVTVQLVDAAKGFQIWSERYDRELADIFDVQDEITRAIVRRLKVALAIEDAGRLVEVTTTNMEAYQAYLKGRALLYRRGPWVARALESLRKAVELDPRYVQAWAGLADACTVLSYMGERRSDEGMPAALDAATRALEIDPESAEAHNALACASLLWERDFRKAEREFLQALSLNPTYIPARCWYGLFFLQWSVARLDEGLGHAWQAFRSDPHSAYASSVVSFALGTMGRAQEAVIYGKMAVEQDPPSFLGRWTLQFAYRWNGQYEEALALAETLWAESPMTWVAIQLVPTYAKLGRLEQARVIYDQLLARRDCAYVSPFALAICASGLGDHEAAITFSASAVQCRDVLLALFHWWIPDLDPLRADPRFSRLIEQFNARKR